MFWALVPPSVYLLTWGGETASELDPALVKPDAIQENPEDSLLSFFSHPWPVATKSKGQETNICG